MSTSKKPVLAKGWMRALAFLVVFTGVIVSGNMAYTSQRIFTALPLLYSNTIIFCLATIITVPLFRVAIDRKSVYSLGFKKPTQRGDTALGMLFPIAILGTGSLILYFNGNISFDGYSFSWRDVLTSVVLMMLIALAEEIVFRGYILNNLLDSFSGITALIFSALIFALLHAGNPQAGVLAVINVFLAGLVLGLGFTLTHSLWFPILFHFVWNFIQGPVLGYAVSGLPVNAIVDTKTSGNALMTGGSFGFEASIIETILFVIIFLVLYLHNARISVHEATSDT